MHWSQPSKARYQLLAWGDAATGAQFEPLAIATTLLIEELGLPVDVQIVGDPAHNAVVLKITGGKALPLPFLLPPGASSWLTDLPAIWQHLAGAARKPALAVSSISGHFSEACDLGTLVPLSSNRLMGALERMLMSESGATPDASMAFEAAKLELLSYLRLLNGIAESGEGAKGFHFFGSGDVVPNTPVDCYIAPQLALVQVAFVTYCGWNPFAITASTPRVRGGSGAGGGSTPFSEEATPGGVMRRELIPALPPASHTTTTPTFLGAAMPSNKPTFAALGEYLARWEARESWRRARIEPVGLLSYLASLVRAGRADTGIPASLMMETETSAASSSSSSMADEKQQQREQQFGQQQAAAGGGAATGVFGSGTSV